MVLRETVDSVRTFEAVEGLAVIDLELRMVVDVLEGVAKQTWLLAVTLPGLAILVRFDFLC
jgi:hypothetical protein